MSLLNEYEYGQNTFDVSKLILQEYGAIGRGQLREE